MEKVHLSVSDLYRQKIIFENIFENSSQRKKKTLREKERKKGSNSSSVLPHFALSLFPQEPFGSFLYQKEEVLARRDDVLM